MKTTLKEAIRFHGHLGPYLVLGILAGELALKRLGIKRYFGLRVRVTGVDKKPKSCFIDGLQLSTGATYGKGNIFSLNGSVITAAFKNLQNKKEIKITFKKSLLKELKEARTHKASELLAKGLYKTHSNRLFNIT